MTTQILPTIGDPQDLDGLSLPKLEQLAEEGMIFARMYTEPGCTPSRAAMMTGQLASRVRAYDNAAEMPSDIPTFAHYLKSLGYRTCLAGKMHFVGPDQLHGFEERHTTDIYPADFNWMASVGAIGFGLSQLIFVYVLLTAKKGAKATDRVWEAPRGLEWTVPSPAPYHTFDTPPKVRVAQESFE